MDILTPLVGKLAELAKLRQGRKDKFFSVVIKDSYDLAKKVKQDYVKTLFEFRDLFENGESSETIMVFLERNRYREVESRQHIREIWNELHAGDLTQFEYGVLSLVHGGFSHNEFLAQELKFCDAILTDSRMETDRRTEAERIFTRSMTHLEQIWSQIECGYIGYQKDFLRG